MITRYFLQPNPIPSKSNFPHIGLNLLLFTIWFMEYEINLLREVSGTQVMIALRETASRLEWHYSSSVSSWSASPGSVKFKPIKFAVKLKTSRFFGDSVSVGIEPDEQYSKLYLFSKYGYGLSGKDLEKLTLTLYNIL